MAIRRELLAGLDRLRGRSVTVAELVGHPRKRNVVALRHDVDHDLDLALELAAAEQSRGLRATYFLLHTASYWQDPQFDLKVRQLEAYGHEVGLHVNVLTEWHVGVIDAVEARLAEHLGQLRASGVTVTGTSAHGDKRCYEDRFINYWIWKELRGRDPAESESGLSAEGVATDDPGRRIEYPPDSVLTRADRRAFQLWSISQKEHGIEYEAVKARFDRYWSDTGGKWQYGDPFEADLDSGRHQILIHPWWWRAEPRPIFCLSTARSGSKWLATMIDSASSAAGFHDWTLNHDRTDRSYPTRVRTRFEYQELVDDLKEAARLVRVGFAHRRSLKRDAVEVNTYLEPFVYYLAAQSPKPTLVHLHRDARDVVRSILARGWYATPFDPAHRTVPMPDWNELTQLERACWYVRFTQERLIEATDLSLSMERATTDPDYLAEQLEELGLVLHPLLAEKHRKAINATREFTVAPLANWPTRDRATFERICGPVQLALGYETGADWITDPAEALRSGVGKRSIRLPDLEPSPRRVEAKRVGKRLRCKVSQSHSNAHLVLAPSAGTWHELAKSAGIACERDSWAVCTVKAGKSSIEGRIFALYFGRYREQVAQHELGTLRSGETVQAPLAPPPKATHCALALHFGGSDAGALELESLELRWFKYPPGYRMMLHHA